MSSKPSVSKIATATLTVSNMLNKEDVYNWVNGIPGKSKEIIVSDIKVEPDKVSFDITGGSDLQALSPEGIGLKIKDYADKNNPPFNLEKGLVIVDRVIPDPMWDW